MPPAKLETATPGLKFMIGNALRAGDHHSFNYENVAVYSIFTEKANTYTQFYFPQRTQYRRAGYQRWSRRAFFCHNHRCSDNQKTEVGEASDKLSISGPMRYFKSTPSATNECSDESAHLL